MNLTLQDLLSTPHIGSELGSLKPSQKFKNVSTDSRELRRGDLFIALRGENFDGHTFIAQAAALGASCAVVDVKWYKAQRGKKLPLPVFVVKDTLSSMGELALMYRRKFSMPILVIAGSNGKTTTKELVAHVLGTSFNVLKTEANFNNQVGVPQMLFQLKRSHDIAVLEIGTNHPGEIVQLTNICEPTHALITNIGREHLEFFKNIDGVAREELSAFAITEELGGFGFINYDDRYTRSFRPFFAEWSISYGISKDADVTATHLGFTKDVRSKIEVKAGKITFTAATNIVSDYAPNIIACVTAVALHFNMKPAAIKKALERFVPHSKRMEITKTRSGVTIINDAYNANPESFASALATLDMIPTRGKKYIVCGDMFELGTRSKSEHTALGKLIRSYPLAGSYFTGKDMKHAQKAHGKRSAKHFEKKAEIATELRAIIRRGDIVLIKGSRGMRMEEIAAAL